MTKAIGFIYIALTVILTVYGQMIIKWRLPRFGSFPDDWAGRFQYFLAAFSDLFILSGFVAAFIASLTWMAALTRFDLSYAYPFMSASFVLVLLCSALFLGETASFSKIAGLALIVIGMIVASKG